VILAKRPEVERFLARPSEGATAGVRAALIYGRDRGGVRERADALALKITDRPDDPFDAALLTDGDLDEGRLEGELTALSMTGGRRLVRLKIGDGRAAAERTAAEALTAHAEGTLNPDAFFLIEAGALERSSPLRKAAEAAKAAVCIPVYEDDTGDVARMVREALGAERLGLNPEALDLFVARLPRERGVARQEVERLALYLGPGSGHTATAEDLTDFLGVEPDASLSEAAADAFGGRAAPAQASLRRARAEGEGGPAAVRALGMYLFRLRRALVLTKNGAGAQEAAKAAGVFWKQEREFLRQLRAWKLADLDALQPEVLEADKACKTTGYPDGLVAERLAMQIAGKARRLGL
jgi:DNA polymerase-3 subunit delta